MMLLFVFLINSYGSGSNILGLTSNYCYGNNKVLMTGAQTSACCTFSTKIAYSSTNTSSNLTTIESATGVATIQLAGLALTEPASGGTFFCPTGYDMISGIAIKAGGDMTQIYSVLLNIRQLMTPHTGTQPSIASVPTLGTASAPATIGSTTPVADAIGATTGVAATGTNGSPLTTQSGMLGATAGTMPMAGSQQPSSPFAMPSPAGRSSGSSGGSGGGGGFGAGFSDGGAAPGSDVQDPSRQPADILASFGSVMASGGGAFRHGGSGGGEVVVSLGKNKAEAAAAALIAGKVMLSADPDDYFARIDLNQNLFKIVSARYKDLADSLIGIPH